MNLFANTRQLRHSQLRAPKFPYIFPHNREMRNRDRFADDCFHRQFLGHSIRRTAAIANPLQTFRGAGLLNPTKLFLKAEAVIVIALVDDLAVLDLHEGYPVEAE